MTPAAELVKTIRAARFALGGMWDWKDREELKEAATRLERYEAALQKIRAGDYFSDPEFGPDARMLAQKALQGD